MTFRLVKNRRAVYFYPGVILVLTSLVLFAFTYFPLILVYFSPSPQLKYSTEGEFVINIPKISAQAPVVVGVDPWNEEDYKRALMFGVAQAKGTSLPGQKGSIFLFAHSSLEPWEMTRTNTSFLRLGELQRGDLINIKNGNFVYSYVVREKKEVWPNQVGFLTESSRNQLILQTCTPVGTALRRLLVFADPT